MLDIELGVKNLLQTCAGAQPGERFLIIEEEGDSSVFDSRLAEVVSAQASRFGLFVERLPVRFQPEVNGLPDWLTSTVSDFDHVLFLSRLGDQLRFTRMPDGTKPIVSFVLDREGMASPLGTACYKKFTELK